MMPVNRWSVKKLADGRWGVFKSGSWWDVFPTLNEAHTYATQSAVAEDLYEPGGLTYLKFLKEKACR